jgi:acyl-CoA thioesterase
LRFAEASAVERTDEGTWAGNVQPNWDIFGIANGGYLMSIAGRAMSEAAEGRMPVSLTSHFTRPVSAGPVVISVEPIKTGRTFSTMRSQLTSETGSLSLIGSFADPDRTANDTDYLAVGPEEMPSPDDCVRAVPAVDGPLPPPLVAQFELRIHPDDASALEGRPSGVATVRGWFRFHDNEPVDPIGVLLVADAFPPAIFNLDRPMGWTPTVEMTTHVRSVPATEWLHCAFTTRFVTGGFLEEDGEIWDESGRLVALSRQLALVAR